MVGTGAARFAVKMASLLAGAALMSACASTAHTPATTGSSPAAGGGTTSAASSSAASSPAGTGVAIETRSGPLGTFLTDAQGKALYMFAAEASTTSACDSSCQQTWPPLTTTVSATAMSGAQASLISTVSGPNGTLQVTYAGHRLYYYASDSAPGDTKGQGFDSFGAKWWLLTPSGQPITSTSGGGSSSASSSSGGGGGGWA